MTVNLKNVHIGVHPINWCNDDMPDLGDQYSFEDIVEQAREADLIAQINKADASKK